MSGIRKAWSVCKLEFLRWKKAYRLYMILALLLLFSLQYTEQLFTFAEQMGYPVTPWLLPFLLTSMNGRFGIYFCAVLYFGNLFSTQPIEKYLLLRSGGRSYLLGKVFYIFAAALVYTLLAAVLPLLPYLGQIYWSNDWGMILGSYERLASYHPGNGIYISPLITQYLTPLQAMGASFGLLWLTLSMLGSVIYLLNAASGKIYGIIVGGVLAGLDFFAASFFSLPQQQAMSVYISPVTTSNLDFLLYGTDTKQFWYPTIGTSFGILIGLLVVLIALMFILQRIAYRSGSTHQCFHMMGE